MYRMLLGTERYQVGSHRCFHLSHAPGNRRAERNAEMGQTGGRTLLLVLLLVLLELNT